MSCGRGIIIVVTVERLLQHSEIYKKFVLFVLPWILLQDDNGYKKRGLGLSHATLDDIRMEFAPDLKFLSFSAVSKFMRRGRVIAASPKWRSKSND